MTEMLRRGRHRVRIAGGPEDLRACQALRHLCFVENAGHPARPGGLETDPHDAICTHLLVEEEGGGPPVCCFRLLPLASGAEIGRSYAARFYDLDLLSRRAEPMLELGRFCIRPGVPDPDVLRVAWGALARIVDGQGTGMLFGCSSFTGTDPEAHRPALGLLARRHLAPGRWRPGRRAAEVVPLKPDGPHGDGARLPPLLRSYLAMGGRVSDHAVVDRELGTLHVFTGLEIDAIPPARARALRAVSAGT